MIIVIFHIYWDKPGNQGRSPVKDGKILLSFFHFQCSLAIATCGLWICDELFFGADCRLHFWKHQVKFSCFQSRALSWFSLPCCSIALSMGGKVCKLLVLQDAATEKTLPRFTMVMDFSHQHSRSNLRKKKSPESSNGSSSGPSIFWTQSTFVWSPPVASIHFPALFDSVWKCPGQLHVTRASRSLSCWQAQAGTHQFQSQFHLYARFQFQVEGVHPQNMRRGMTMIQSFKQGIRVLGFRMASALTHRSPT